MSEDSLNSRDGATGLSERAVCLSKVVEASPGDTAPKYIVRDRDGIYGDQFRLRLSGLSIDEVPHRTAVPGRIPTLSALWAPHAEREPSTVIGRGWSFGDGHPPGRMS